jgi:hypothetical protein
MFITAQAAVQRLAADCLATGRRQKQCIDHIGVDCSGAGPSVRVTEL